MARRPDGTYQKVFTAVTRTIISSLDFNKQIDDIAVALTDSLNVHGTAVVTADIKMNGWSFTGMRPAIASGEPLTLGQATGSGLSYPSTVTGTDAIVMTYSPPITVLTANMEISFLSLGPNTTTSPTLQIDSSLQAKPILRPTQGTVNIGELGPVGTLLKVRYDQHLDSFVIFNNLYAEDNGVNMFTQANFFNGGFSKGLQNLTFSNSIAPDLSKGSNMSLLVTGETSFTQFLNQANYVGCEFSLLVKQDATGSHPVTFSNAYFVYDGASITTNGAPNAISFYNGVIVSASGPASIRLYPVAQQSAINFGSSNDVSGSVKTFGFPANPKRITIAFEGVVCSGSSGILVQLGDGTTFVTTGYTSGVSYAGSQGGGQLTSTQGFVLNGNQGDRRTGLMQIWRFDNAGTWISSVDGTFTNSGYSFTGGGYVSNMNVTSVRVTNVNATETFTSGTVFIEYEN